VTRRRIEVLNSIEDLSLKAAEVLVAEAAAAIAGRGKFSVALSGGSTPAPVYSLLSEDEYRSRIKWDRIHFFWADERCVPQDHPDSNYKLAFDLLLSKVPVPHSNIHRIQGELGPDRAANTYENELGTFFPDLPIPSFDLIFLGVGTDGHTASIFPNVVKDDNFARAAIPVYMEGTGIQRVSLTLPVLNNAGTVVFLVSGKAKSRIVRDVLEGTNSGFPAARVNPDWGQAIWLIDREAAELLTNLKMMQI
jgi:6-phosphogluconolactonase